MNKILLILILINLDVVHAEETYKTKGEQSMNIEWLTGTDGNTRGRIETVDTGKKTVYNKYGEMKGFYEDGVTYDNYGNRVANYEDLKSLIK